MASIKNVHPTIYLSISDFELYEFTSYTKISDYYSIIADLNILVSIKKSSGIYYTNTKEILDTLYSTNSVVVTFNTNNPICEQILIFFNLLRLNRTTENL